MSGAIDLSSARTLVTWAREDTQEFDAITEVYLTAHPYTAIVEDDSESPHKLLKVGITPMPDQLRKLASHALWDLKHALDHATYAAIVAVTRSVPKDVHFPWCSHPNDLTAKLTHRNGKYPPELHALFRSFEPYPTGNGYSGGHDVFVALNKMANTSKHAAALRPGSRFAMQQAEGTGGGLVCLFEDAWDSVKQQLTLGRFRQDADIKMQLQFASFIEFDEVEAVKGYPAGELLETFADAVTTIIDEIERVVTGIAAARI